jgi:hypothetical protein
MFKKYEAWWAGCRPGNWGARHAQSSLQGLAKVKRYGWLFRMGGRLRFRN